MTAAAWYTLAVVGLMFAVMASGRATPAGAVLTAVIALLAAGVIDADAAFSGFSNAAPITVAALYVVARAVEESGALRPLVTAALGRGGGRGVGLLRLLLPAAAASALLNNTPIVAMLIRPVCEWAERRGTTPSHYLMPLSFAVLLGGVVTTIGTSTNLLVSGLLERAGYAPLGLFEITYVGLPVALAGVLTLALTATRLLPERKPPRSGLQDAGRDFVVRMVVQPDGPVAGSTIEAAGLRHLDGVFLVQVERDGEPTAPVAPTMHLRGGDHLLFVGQARTILDLQRHAGLDSAERPHMMELDRPDRCVVEAVIGRESPLLGRTPKDVGFRERYQAAIVGIHREGQPLVAQLGRIELRLGDTLLLLTDPGFVGRWSGRADFLVMTPLDGRDAPPIDRIRAASAGLVTFVLVGVTGTGLMPILPASLVAAVVLVGTRVVSGRAARDAIEIDVLIVIAGSFGVGAAMEASGLAGVIGGAIVGLGADYGPRVVLLGVALATVTLTELISNNAAAALIFPIALASAEQLGADPRAFAIVVAVSASNSFLTPIGYQTNTMVYGPGGYRFTDYARLGLPLTVVMVVVCVLTA